jgi:hypothetical protein
MNLNRGTARPVAMLACLASLALTLAAQQSSILSVSGQQGTAKVVQFQGHNYVDVDGLARIVNGSISFQASQIVLTLANAGPVQNDSPQPAGFSTAFLKAGIEAMARFREWHAALKTGIERGVPLNTGWLNTYQAQARESLNLASAAISTDSDRSAYALAVNLFNNLKALTDKYVQLTDSQTYFAPDALQSDTLDQSIVACVAQWPQWAPPNNSLKTVHANENFIYLPLAPVPNDSSR